MGWMLGRGIRGEMVSPGRDFFVVETQHLEKAHSERVGKEMTEQTRPEQTALSLSLSSHSSPCSSSRPQRTRIHHRSIFYVM